MLARLRFNVGGQLGEVWAQALRKHDFQQTHKNSGHWFCVGALVAAGRANLTHRLLVYAALIFGAMVLGAAVAPRCPWSWRPWRCIG